jgi:hypothetical protein
MIFLKNITLILSLARRSVGRRNWVSGENFETEWEIAVSLYLGTFAKLRKAAISFVMSVRPSVRPHGITQLPLEGISCDFFNISLFLETLTIKFSFH